MKKRASAKKPAAGKSAAKKATKVAKPVVKSSAGERSSGATGKYTPTPIQGIGWAPFRYPLS
jgi:hypothetical protein